MKKNTFFKSAIVVITLLLSCSIVAFPQKNSIDTIWYKGLSEGFLFHDYFMIQITDDWAIVNQFSEMDHRVSQAVCDTLHKTASGEYEGRCFTVSGSKRKRLISKSDCSYVININTRPCKKCNIKELWYLKNRIPLDKISLNNISVKDQMPLKEKLYNFEPTLFLKEMEEFNLLHNIP